MRQPTDPTQLQPPDATLYRAAVAIACQEIQLIWSRYTGFIVMNGFLVSALTNEAARNNDVLLCTIGVVVLVLNCVWHMLNYCGWHNQNLLYRQAGALFTCEVGLISDYFRNKNFKPIGWIYWIAQVIPTMFSLIALPCLEQGVDKLASVGTASSWLIATVVWLLAAGCVLLIEYKAIANDATTAIPA